MSFNKIFLELILDGLAQTLVPLPVDIEISNNSNN